MPADLKKHTYGALLPKNILASASYFLTSSGPGCTSLLDLDEEKFNRNIHRAGFIDAAVEAITRDFLSGPAQRYYGASADNFPFTRTLTSILPSIDQSVFPLQSKIEFVHSPHELHPEIAVRILDEERKCIAQTHLLGINDKLRPPTSQSWKNFEKISHNGTGRACSKDKVASGDTFKDLISALQVDESNNILCACTFPRDHALSNSSDDDCVPRYALLEIVHSFAEKALECFQVKSLDQSFAISTKLRFIASDFESLLLNSRSTSQVFVNRDECILPKVDTPMSIISPGYTVHTSRDTPIWKAAAGLPHLSPTAQALKIPVTITQSGLKVMKGSFYFTPLRGRAL